MSLAWGLFFAMWGMLMLVGLGATAASAYIPLEIDDAQRRRIIGLGIGASLFAPLVVVSAVIGAVGVILWFIGRGLYLLPGELAGLIREAQRR